MSGEEYFLDERPGEDTPEITPDWEDPGDGGGGGSGGSGGGGGGWGPGGGGGGSWWYPGSGSEEPEEPEPPEAEPEEDDEDPENAKILKRSHAGMLLRCASGHLLLGDLTCDPDPHLRLWIRGEGCEDHKQCVLWRLSGGRAAFDCPQPETEDQAEGSALVLCKHLFLQEGDFTLDLRWQGGHYDHAKVGEMRILLFGVELGWKVYPLSWITAATVRITQEGKVFVNGIEGTL